MAEPNQFFAPYLTFRAMQFDGSRESAAAIAAAFPGRVAWSVERAGVLLARAKQLVGAEALHAFEPGSWLVEVDRFADVVVLYRDEHFRAIYAATPRRESGQ